MADTNHEGRQRVYLTVHENFVREDIHYQDRRSGEDRTTNLVTLPMGSVTRLNVRSSPVWRSRYVTFSRTKFSCSVR